MKIANTNANIVKSHVDKLSKAHMVCDINSLFKNKEYVLGLSDSPNKKMEKHKFGNLSKNIYRSTSAKKAVYIKMSNDYSLSNNSQTSKMYFFNYFSLLVGYFRRFDDYSLYKMSNRCDKEYAHYYDDRVIDDLLNQETSHLYYCDSSFTYSIVDPIANSKALDMITGNNTYLSNIPAHQFTYYSKWEFSKVMETISFGSASNKVYSLFLSYAGNKLKSNNKIKILWWQHIVASLFSRVDLLFNHRLFDAKENYFDLVDGCFKKLNANEFEKKAKDSLEITWQHSNLNNNQFYSRIGLVFSLASLFISLVAFGWIGFIVPTLKDQPSDYWGLIQKFLITTKFHVVASIAAIPFVLWVLLNVFDFLYVLFLKRKMVNTFLRNEKHPSTK